MAEQPPSFRFEDVPIDEGRRMSRGSQLEPMLSHALAQNIPSLDASARGWQAPLRHLLGHSRGEVDMNLEQLLAFCDLERGFTHEDLEHAYRALVQLWHPDKYAYNARLQRKAAEKLKAINRAYADLKDVRSRPSLPGDRHASPAGSAPLTTHRGPQARETPEAAHAGVRHTAHASETPPTAQRSRTARMGRMVRRCRRGKLL